jgi:hypothetical protein
MQYITVNESYFTINVNKTDKLENECDINE